MTGYRSRYLRHDCCGGENCYIAQLPNWDDIIDCFPGAIRPTDVDGLVEIGGRLLVMEEKRPGVGPDEGQRLALKQLALHDGVTVVYFRPKSGVVEVGADMEVLTIIGGEPSGWQDCTREAFLDWLRDWSARAREAS